ncbi:MAG: VWA domain-containing protein [Coraliomargaritaceae bacterium]
MNAFTFQEPDAFALLILLLPLAALQARARHQKRLLARSMGEAIVGASAQNSCKDLLRLGAALLIIIALCRPGYSPKEQSTIKTGRDVVFALDVSRSMLAEDLYPSRLEVAKQGIRDALDALANQRVGLIVYGGSASILCPLTYDYDFVRYMLDKAYPRSVDFGGTALQSAVEKAVDQVFLTGREGVQDLIILTDGGDHASDLDKTIGQLESNQVDILLIGLGDPRSGSPIPIKDDDGNNTFLRIDNQLVDTKLEDKALREFAARTQWANYEAVGLSPFHLGQLYVNYAKERPADSTEIEESITLYKEAAFLIMPLALLLLFLSELSGKVRIKTAELLFIASLSILFTSSDASAQEETYFHSFTQASNLLREGQAEAAEALFSELYKTASDKESSAELLAALQLNQAICKLHSAEEMKKQNLSLALQKKEEALQDLLNAKRYNKNLERAGYLLEQTFLQIADLLSQIKKQEAAQLELKEAIAQIIAHLEDLLKAQKTVRAQVTKNIPISENGNSNQTIHLIFEQQVELIRESRKIEQAMFIVNQELLAPQEDVRGRESLMTKPLEWIEEVIQAQKEAQTTLAGEYEQSEIHLEVAEKTIEVILEYLKKGKTSDEKTQPDDFDASEEYEYSEEEDPTTHSSSTVAGDLTANATMQALPVPNYSADDILIEEQQSQQFREQKRATANAAKVEKDY